MPHLPAIQAREPIPPVNAQVQIDLDQVFGPPPADTRPTPGGISLTGRALGMLRRWERAADGRWLGVVDIHLNRTHGDVRGSYRWVGALIPAEAMTLLGTT